MVTAWNDEPFTPHSLDDWDRMLARKLPELPGVPKTGDIPLEIREAYAHHALAVGPFVTEDVKSVGRAIDFARRAGAGPLGERRLVIINGAYHQGKTHCALVYALQNWRITRATSSGGSPNRLIPWVYVELSGSGEGRSLVRSILTFIGVPVPVRAAMPELVEILRRIAPQIGLKGVIIDDLGSAANDAGAAARPGSMANALKSLVMQVPATFVLIGTDLRTKPMFSTTKPVAPAQQLLRRATWVELTPWPAPTSAPGYWHALVQTVINNIRFLRPGQNRIMNQPGLQTVVRLAEGRPGSAILLLQNAAADAILDAKLLDIGRLEQTAQKLRGDVS